MKIKHLLLIFLLLTGSIMTGQSQSFRNFTVSDGLPSNNVSGVAIDGFNRKWFGTQSGVALFNDTIWTTWTKADGLINDYINCITVDVNNHIWVGTDDGLSKFDGSQWSSYTKTDGLVDNMVNFIAGAADGSVWIGTSAGASHFDGTNWKNYTTTDGLPGNMISYITNDQNGNVWLGTFLGGLSKFDGKAFTTFTKADSLPGNNIISVANGASNTRWIGTFYGVAVFDSQDKWVTTYRKTNGLYNNFSQDIAMDSKGTMWFADYDIYTLDAGLSKKSSSGWKTFTVSDGLINAPLRRLAVDTADNIWIATGYGVSKLTDAAEGIHDATTLPGHIYPNPATTEIHLDGLTSAGTLRLFTMTGIEVVSRSLSNGANTISLQNLDAGIYLIRCTTGTGVYTEQLIIR